MRASALFVLDWLFLVPKETLKPKDAGLVAGSGQAVVSPGQRYQRANRLAPTAPRMASRAIAMVYQVATKSGESLVHWAA
jgi:hypothetical protein